MRSWIYRFSGALVSVVTSNFHQNARKGIKPRFRLNPEGHQNAASENVSFSTVLRSSKTASTTKSYERLLLHVFLLLFSSLRFRSWYGAFLGGWYDGLLDHGTMVGTIVPIVPKQKHAA